MCTRIQSSGSEIVETTWSKRPTLKRRQQLGVYFPRKRRIQKCQTTWMYQMYIAALAVCPCTASGSVMQPNWQRICFAAHFSFHLHLLQLSCVCIFKVQNHLNIIRGCFLKAFENRASAITMRRVSVHIKRNSSLVLWQTISE